MNRIKQLRTEKGMKQTELAKILKIGQATMSNWETGRSEPDYDALIEMSEIFGTSIDYILGNSDIKSALLRGRRAFCRRGGAAQTVSSGAGGVAGRGASCSGGKPAQRIVFISSSAACGSASPRTRRINCCSFAVITCPPENRTSVCIFNNTSSRNFVKAFTKYCISKFNRCSI